jgi:phosphoglycerate dehydrogenase-like enzyme
MNAAVASSAFDVIRDRAPEQIEVVRLEDDADLSRVDFLVPPAGDRSILKVLPDLDRLSVVQVLSAGTDWIEDHVPPGATLCSARGARDAPVAEWVMGALLGTSTGLLDGATRRAWHSRHLEDLGSWTVLVVGMGSIGRLVEQRLATFGTNVVGVASRARDGVHGVDELPELLGPADAVVLLTPLTDATRHLIAARELATLRDGALLVNAARGAVIDTEALVPEVQTGRIRAVLDVTDPEPLPDEHPLWTAPGVLSITPHIGGDSPAGHAAAAALAGEQLARWATGGELQNVVKRGER